MTAHDDIAEVRASFEKLRLAGRTSDILKVWCDDGTDALDRVEALLREQHAEIARLEQRVTQVGDLVGFRDAWKQRAEAAEAEVARLERERDGYKRDFLAASERCERLERDRP